MTNNMQVLKTPIERGRGSIELSNEVMEASRETESLNGGYRSRNKVRQETAGFGASTVERFDTNNSVQKLIDKDDS